ncbi:hypothetical protein HO924_00400 [Streptococcus suis]|nr:hypothetical protein [Streptococcus suis]
MIYLFDKDEKLIKIVRKSAVKTALQKYSLTTERYVSDRLTVELKGLNADELEQVEYMAIQTMEDAHTFHYFYVAQKFSDELTTLIGVQSGIEELRKSPVFDKRPKNAFARDVITDLLAGTNWLARFVGETTPHSTNFYYTSIFDALKKVCEVWDLEMQFFVEMNGNRIGARYIDFKQRIGEAVGKRVVYGHNALQILQEVERTNIFTALIGRGKGEETGAGYGRKITFEDVTWSTAQGKPVNKPAGQKYLELPLMTRQYGIKNADGSMRPKIGFVDFSEEENPEILIERTYKALIDAARPQLTLKTSSVYLKGVKIGDTIRVVRHDKKLDYDTRIFEITFNRLNNQSSDIKLGDRIGESNEAKVQTIADKAVEQFLTNEFSTFVQNLPNHLPSADGFNNNWYGAEDPTVQYPGKVLINDIWFKPDSEHEGHKIMLRWTGEVWEEILRTYESESLRDRIEEEIAQVTQSMQAQSEEHDRQVADILSKTQSVEDLANQAKSDAASAITQALQSKDEAIADARAQVSTVSQALNTAKSELQSAIASADQKARDSQASATALRNDLNLQASKILEQAQTQTALTNRVSTVETLADGTRSTVAELSKTVNNATGDIASVTSRTKTVEDNLNQTRTQYEALTQTVNAQTGQIDSINRKTADLQSGIDGVNNRFETIWASENNLLSNTETLSTYSPLAFPTNNYLGRAIKRITKSANTSAFSEGLVMQTNETLVNPKEMILSFYVKANRDARIRCFMYNPNANKDVATSDGYTAKSSADGMAVLNVTTSWQRVWIKWTYLVNYLAKPRIIIGRILETYDTDVSVDISAPALYHGHHNKEWSPAGLDFKNELATYVQSAQESSAELVRRIETADGKAVDAKAYAQQTADGFNTRIESLESYKNAEGTRATQYLTASRTETAKQLTAERTAIANNYVAKSIYDENVRGTTLKLNEIKTTADTAKQNLATYQNTVDRKLEELTTSTQTLDGKINTASAKVDTIAGQIRTEISEVEGKIPTSVVGNNIYAISNNSPISTNHTSGFNQDITTGIISFNTTGSDSYIGQVINHPATYIPTMGIKIPVIQGEDISISLTNSLFTKNYVQYFKNDGNSVKNFKSYPSQKFTVPASELAGVDFITFRYGIGNSTFSIGDKIETRVKVEYGNANTDWTPATEDLLTEISNAKTIIQTTAEGQTQLSTKVEQQGKTLVSNTADIKTLNDKVALTVTKTTFDNLEKRTTTAETTISTQAGEISKRLTSTQVESAITGKGYQTKSQVDSNITGRGYITNSALQPYALSTTVQNLVKETADSFSRTISETKALIPSGESNLVKWGRPGEKSEYVNAEITTHPFFYNSNSGARMYVIRNKSSTAEKNVSFNRFAVERNTEYTLYFKGFNNSSLVDMDVWFLKRVRGSTAIYDNAQLLVANRKLSTGKFDEVVVTFNTGNFDEGFIRFDNNKSVAEGTSADLYFGDVSVKKGKSNNGWSPSVEELATVTALHSVRDTVDSHTRTIGAVGTSGSILDNVSKVTQTAAGLVQEVSGANGLKTQVSTLAGSYAIKSLTKAGDVLGQINLNKDGSIKLDGSLVQITGKTYIQDGVITSAKIAGLDAGKITTGTLDAARIAVNSIDGSKMVFDQAFVNKMTANEAYLKQLFAKNAFITSVQAVAISASNVTTGILRATNGAMDVNLDNASMIFRQDAKIEFQSENNTLFRTRNGTSAFIHFRDDSYNGVYTAMGVNADNTGTQNDYSSGLFAGVRVIRTNPNRYSGTAVDQVQIVADEVRFRDAYGYDRDYLTIIWDKGSKIDLVQWMRQFNTNFKHLVNITGRGDVIKTF